MRRGSSSPLLYSRLYVHYLSLSTAQDGIINSVLVLRLELTGILATIARNRAGNDSRGRSGAGKFLSNFEPIMNVSEVPQRLSEGCGHTSRCCWRPIWIWMLPFVEQLFRLVVEYLSKENTDQRVSRVDPSSMHTLCCLGSFMPLLASNSDRM